MRKNVENIKKVSLIKFKEHQISVVLESYENKGIPGLSKLILLK